jgi:hypothetical protein
MTFGILDQPGRLLFTPWTGREKNHHFSSWDEPLPIVDHRDIVLDVFQTAVKE